MKNKYNLCIIAISIAAFTSCKKDETTPVVSTPQFQAGQEISGENLSGSVKGTMTSGKTYYFSEPITINENDTLVMQKGVKLLARNPNAQLIVKGVFISLGTKDSPNWITGEDAYLNPTKYKNTVLLDPNMDPAIKPGGKLWAGIQCDVTCQLLDIKWTHIEFSGGTASQTNPPAGYDPGDDLFTILFQNADGIFILEDSWVYGTTTDAARMLGGKVSIMRNTLEKIGYNDADCFNAKNSTTGDMAYNLFLGTPKGGTKSSNKGTYGNVQTNINMYNNTYISGGLRSVDPDRGSNANIEQGAKGKVYNNIFVNCRTGLRILENPAADFANTSYGNNLSYGDTKEIVNEFYPTTHATEPQSTDIPEPSTFYPGYPNSYTLGEVYDAPQLIGKNNPEFKNFPLPIAASELSKLTLFNFQGNYDFHLMKSSPAIGKGTNSFSAVDATSSLVVPALKANVTPPNIDLGAFPTNGQGNQH